MCEDVRDIETWLRDPESEFAKATTSGDLKADRSKIIVAGASAGAHLALLKVRFLSFSLSPFKDLGGNMKEEEN